MKSAICLGAIGTLALGWTIWQEKPRGAVQGTLWRRNGAVEGVRVALVGLDDRNRGQWFRARADAQGRFAGEKLTAGRYRVIAQRGRWRGEAVVWVGEAQTASLKFELKRLTPRVPLNQPRRDETAVARRTENILDALPRLSRPLLDTLRDNNRSGAVRDEAERAREVPLAVVVAQAGAESSFRPALSGDLDEIGLFQLRPSTANDQGFGRVEISRLRDPATNTRLATRYLGRLRLHFDDLRLALIAYNQGPGRTQREGLYPSAQIYADAVLRAATHPRLRARLRQLDPGWERPEPAETPFAPIVR